MILNNAKKWIIRIIELIAILWILLFAYIAGEVLGFAINELRSGSVVQQLDDYNHYEIPTKVYDINNKLIAEFSSKKRKLIYYNELPDNLINAFIVTEDVRFYDHSGVDTYSIFRAFVKNIQAQKIVEGGSTITQQLAKLFFTDGDKTFRRKVIELWYTLLIEKRYLKNEIFEKYINKIYFGHGIYGIGAASQYFFNKDLNELTIAECAMLAAIPSSPNKFSPLKNQELSKQRHLIILNKLVEKGLISQQEAHYSFDLFWKDINFRTASLKTTEFRIRKKDKAPYFTEHVRQLAEHYITKKLGKDKHYLYTGGLKIYTTLDLDKQKLAHQYLKEQLEKQNKLNQSKNKKKVYNKKTDLNKSYMLKTVYNLSSNNPLSNVVNGIDFTKPILSLFDSVNISFTINKLLKNYRNTSTQNNHNQSCEGSLVCIDHNNGHIVALVGGSGFTLNNQFNRALQAKRQPGSTFKAFIYGAALEFQHYHPDMLVEYKLVNKESEYLEQNGEGESYSISLREALSKSVNSISKALIQKVGPDRVVQFSAPMLGLKNNQLASDYGLALGTVEVTPFELCRGFAVYANEGREVHPIAIRKILYRDNSTMVDFEQEAKKREQRQLMSSQVAIMMTDMLQNVILHGTASKSVNRVGFYRPSAGKTGTTDDCKDAWFVGYTPNYTTAVWIGYDSGQSLGYRQYGGTVAVPVWAKYMKAIHQKLPLTHFKENGLSNIIVKRNVIKQDLELNKSLAMITGGSISTKQKSYNSYNFPKDLTEEYQNWIKKERKKLISKAKTSKRKKYLNYNTNKSQTNNLDFRNEYYSNRKITHKKKTIKRNDIQIKGSSRKSKNEEDLYLNLLTAK